MIGDIAHLVLTTSSGVEGPSAPSHAESEERAIGNMTQSGRLAEPEW